MEIADRMCRVARLQKRWDQVGASLDKVDEIAKDHIPLLKEEREIASEAAGELGQQIKRFDVSDLTDEQMDEVLLRHASEAAAKAPPAAPAPRKRGRSKRRDQT